MAWLDRLRLKAPGLHRALTRRDKPWPMMREVLGFAGLILFGAVLLWGLTAQPFPNRPIVVVESASMMHCGDAAHGGASGNACTAQSYGRFGTIDPGDLIFVRHVGSASEVTTCLSGGELRTVNGIPRATCGPGGRYGYGGDVVVYRPDGTMAHTPIIHRALFYLQINADGTFTIPELGAAGAHLANLRNLPQLDQGDGHILDRLGLQGDNYGDQLVQRLQHMGVADLGSYSGFVTLGDNNPFADQGSLVGYPVQPAWVLGKARGEVPWVGMVNLGFQQLRGQTTWYSEAPSDIKTMFWSCVFVLVGTPTLIGAVQRIRHKRHDAKRGAAADAPEGPDDPGEGAGATSVRRPGPRQP